jgi:hypothetical protein
VRFRRPNCSDPRCVLAVSASTYEDAGQPEAPHAVDRRSNSFQGSVGPLGAAEGNPNAETVNETDAGAIGSRAMLTSDASARRRGP